MRTLIKQYLNAFIKNNLPENSSLFAENFHADFSTIGGVNGRSELRKLSTAGRFEIRYNIVSNEINYDVMGNEITILNCFHFFVNRNGNEYYPLILGGKYKFFIKNNQIEEILFDLEGEMGNTYLAKTNWNYHLVTETRTQKRVYLEDTEAHYLTEQEEIKVVVYRLMLITDTQQCNLLKKYATDNAVVILSDTTYPEQYGPAANERGIQLEQFIAINKQMEDQNHHSLKIIDIRISDEKAYVRAEMFEPAKMGYKHFDVLSVYKPYYNESWQIEMEKKEGRWKVSSMKNQPISKFQQITYTTLEI